MENTNPDTLNETDETSTEETSTEEGTETEGQTNGRKKHSKPPLFIQGDNGEDIPAEKVWGHAVFASALVREFYQYCRDTGQKPSEIVGKCITDGMAAVFQTVEATAEERAQQRATKTLPSDEDTLRKQEEKLLAKARQVQEQLAAIQARSAAIRAGEVVGGVEPLAEVLGETPAETTAPSGRRGRN